MNINNFQNQKSILWKFIFQIFFLLIICSFILSLIIAKNETTTLEKMIINNGNTIASYIAKLSMDPIVDKNFMQLDSIVYNATKGEGIVYAYIVDPDGKILTTRFASVNFNSSDIKEYRSKLIKIDSINELVNTIYSINPVIKVSAPISIDIKNLGTVVVGMSTQIIHQKEVEIIKFVVLISLATALIVGFLLIFLTKKIVLNPITNISNAAAQLAQGELNVYVDHEASGEIKVLIESFNSMTEKLLKQTKMLEEEVENRTQIIHQQQMNLVNSSKMSALGEMAAGIAHEINNPLAVISMNCTMLKRRLSENNLEVDKLNKHVGEIGKTITRIAKIVKGLKTFSRDGSNDDFSPVKIRDILDEILSLCSEKFKHQEIEFNITLSEDLIEQLIECREVQISQILINLLGNSADAIEKLTEKWIKIKVQKRENYVEFRIIDSGAGIPFDIQEKIFQPFFTTKPIGKGTGLGLSLSNSIIKDHQGRFYIDNEVPNTCFVILLPLNIHHIK